MNLDETNKQKQQQQNPAHKKKKLKRQWIKADSADSSLPNYRRLVGIITKYF